MKCEYAPCIVWMALYSFKLKQNTYNCTKVLFKRKKGILNFHAMTHFWSMTLQKYDNCEEIIAIFSTFWKIFIRDLDKQKWKSGFARKALLKWSFFISFWFITHIIQTQVLLNSSNCSFWKTLSIIKKYLRVSQLHSF